ncbi:hypothetical protein Ddye_028593 [Dipteronia dyeriana]|uniref:SWIM-type domain-containing protein n=1 Tax=Dipteronia dyeriana TaxID=168575 RepID=A0AAD9TDN3_9ROSI|nr:hypothetical protein Ddye_028593 [Dipteronia dyeriana]
MKRTIRDTDNSDDNSIPNIDRGSHDNENWHDGVGCGFGNVRGHGCAGPSGFATFSGASFREDGLGDDVDQTSENASPRAWIISEAEGMLQKWFYKRRIKAEKNQTQLNPWATELIKERNIDSEKYTVHPIDYVNFNVKDANKDGLVNLYEKTCSCATFEVDTLPCRHVLAAIWDCYKTTSWIEAYAGTIFPIGHPSDWNIPEDVGSRVVFPPPFRVQAGRPRKKRFKSVGEHGNGKTRNCTICKNSGHKRQNCKNAQPFQAPPPCPSASSETSATSK